MNDKRLLVVDDEPELCEVVRRVATGLGYHVEIASGGEAFMRAFDSFNPTMVVLDIIMPDIDGIELVRWLYGRKSDAKVVVASGSQEAYASLARTLGEAGGLDIVALEKPYKIDSLRNVPSHISC